MMAPDRSLDENFHVLTPEVFEYVFRHELQRAARSQNFLTFVLLKPRFEGRDRDEQALRDVAGLISRGIRETDLLAETPERHLSLVLLDADLPNALRVMDRLMEHLEQYQFASPLTLDIGAACCPTHGSDADTLRSAASASVLPHRGSAPGRPKP